MEKSNRLGPMADQWAALAMMKKNIANLDRTSQHSQTKTKEYYIPPKP
jgi:hypothetical protein